MFKEREYLKTINDMKLRDSGLQKIIDEVTLNLSQSEETARN